MTEPQGAHVGVEGGCTTGVSPLYVQFLSVILCW